MTSELEINGKKLFPIKDAATKVSYSRDYITRLAREKKIIAANVGRQWFVDLESLNNYAEISAMEAEVRKKQLSSQRKEEQKEKVSIEIKKRIRTKQANSLNTRSVVAAATVLTFGLLSGWATNFLLNSDHSTQILASEKIDALVIQARPEVNDKPSKIDKKNNLAVASVAATKTKAELGMIRDIRPISDDIETGILLLPDGSITASATKMFSDEVKILTSDDGVQMVVRVNEEGVPVGKVVPFVTVPVNSSNR